MGTTEANPWLTVFLKDTTYFGKWPTLLKWHWLIVIFTTFAYLLLFQDFLIIISALPPNKDHFMCLTVINQWIFTSILTSARGIPRLCKCSMVPSNDPLSFERGENDCWIHTLWGHSNTFHHTDMIYCVRICGRLYPAMTESFSEHLCPLNVWKFTVAWRW